MKRYCHRFTVCCFWPLSHLSNTHTSLNSMTYISLVIIISIVLSKIITHTSFYIIVVLSLLIPAVRSNNSVLFTQLNISYNYDLEIMYLLSNLVINNNNLTLVLIITVILLTIYKAYEIKTEGKVIVYYFEQLWFYTGYNYSVYYISEKASYFPLHDNILALLHPIAVTWSFFLTSLFLLNLYKNRTIKKRSIRKIIGIKYRLYILLTTSLVLGMIWAGTSQGWGGLWFWDPTEIILVFLLTIIIYTLHSPRRIFNRSLILCFSIVYLEMNKLSLLHGIHNFYKSSTSDSSYLIYIVIATFVIMIITVYTNVIQKTLLEKIWWYISIIMSTIIHFENYKSTPSALVYTSILLISVVTIVTILKKKNAFLLLVPITFFIECSTYIIISGLSAIIILNRKKAKRWILYNHTSPLVLLILVVGAQVLFKSEEQLETTEWLTTSNSMEQHDSILHASEWYENMKNTKLNIPLYATSKVQEKIQIENSFTNTSGMLLVNAKPIWNIDQDICVKLYLNKLILISTGFLFYCRLRKN